MTEILGWFGLTGVVGLIIAAYLLPKLLPDLIVKVVLALAEAGAKVVGWLLDKVAKGAQIIAGSDAAVITVVVACLLSAWFSPFKASRVETVSAHTTRSQPAARTPTKTSSRPTSDFDAIKKHMGWPW